ncbi:ANKDD1A [Symbiodinium sp. KB8]|nr:ANKDD1A [Symbiodinium sp. KB8]
MPGGVSAGQLAFDLLSRGTDSEVMGPASLKDATDVTKKAIADWRDGAGNSLLHYAALGPNPQAVKALLGCGICVDAKNSAGATPLMYAAGRAGPHCPLVELLAAKADLAAADGMDRTVLHYAAFFGCGDAIVRVLREGKTRTCPSVNALTHGLVSPLMVAASSVTTSRRDIVGKPSFQRLHATAALLRAGAKINLADCIGETALMRAIRARNDEVVVMLIISGATVASDSLDKPCAGLLAATRPCVSPGELLVQLEAADALGSAERASDDIARSVIGVDAAKARQVAAQLAAKRVEEAPSAAEAQAGSVAHTAADDGVAGATMASASDHEDEGVADAAAISLSEPPARALPKWSGASLGAVLSCRGCGWSVVALIALLRARANAWDPASSEDEGSAGRAGLPRKAARAVRNWAGVEHVQPIEYLVYALARANALSDSLAFCNPANARDSIGALLFAKMPALATAIGLTSATGLPGRTSVTSFTVGMEARLEVVSATFNEICCLAEVDASGMGFQWARAAGDCIRVADTYDGSALHDFGSWSLEDALELAACAPSDAASLVQLRRALGAATVEEGLRVAVQAAQHSNESVLRAFTPLIWSVSITRGVEPILVTAEGNLDFSAVVRTGAFGRDTTAVQAFLEQLQESFQTLKDASIVAQGFDDKERGLEMTLEHDTWAHLQLFYSALQAAWRERESRRLCSGVGGVELCNSRIGCFDPTAGCAFQ